MLVTYVLYDDRNRYLDYYAGPCRLVKMAPLPEGWSIERFLGDVSQGIVSMADVQEHAREIKGGAL